MLVTNMRTKYKTCSVYCITIGRRCTGAWEEKSDSCRVESTEDCQHNFGGYTSDALCECGEKAESPGDQIKLMMVCKPSPDVLVIIGGNTGIGATSSVETKFGNSSVTDLPEERWGHNAFFLPDSEMVVVCGGKGRHHSVALSKGCISLPSQSSAWKRHFDLNQPRIHASAVTMTSGDVFLLGGSFSGTTSEVLLKGSSTWSQGPELPDPLDSACALRLDDTTFVNIGVGRDHSKLSRYDTAAKMWDHSWPKLKEGRRGHSCARLGSTLLIAGGFSYLTFEYTDSTLTINAATGISILHPLCNVF